MKKIYAGILHDTYTDENGKEVPYDDKIVGFWKGKIFKCSDFPEQMTFEITKEDFEKKVTEVREIF